MPTLPELLKTTVDLQGSDLHLSIGSAPQVRVLAVSPGVVHTRLSAKWMFTRRLENGIKYDGKISEVELDCRMMRQHSFISSMRTM